MFRRETPARLGDYMRRCLGPMAERLGVDYNETFFNPPTTEEALAFDAYRCGQSLLMTFTYPDGWPVPPHARDRHYSKLARKAAKVVRDALLTERGPNAISFMTQGYAQEMAELWRRAASNSDEEHEAAGLMESATRSDLLGMLAGRQWPVTDPFGALERIDLYERQRVADFDNPDATIDLRAYFGRAKVACSAAALALGDVKEYADNLLSSPVAFLDLKFAAGLEQDWVFQGEIWRNLLSDKPRAYAQFMRWR